MWDSLRALGRRVNWWLGLAGNIGLVYAVIFGGAAAFILTTLLAYVVSFYGSLSGIPLFFQLMFYASVGLLSFALVNHAWQRLNVWWARQGAATTTPPTIHMNHPTFHLANSQAQRANVVARAENPGPVVLEPEGTGYQVGTTVERITAPRPLRHDDLIVPYKFGEHGDSPAHEPTATLAVEDVDDVFMIAFSYEVRSPESQIFQTQPGMRLEVWLEVRKKHGGIVRRPTVYSEDGPSFDSLPMEHLFRDDVPNSWRATVSSSHTLYGLPAGTYSLTLVERMGRDLGPREYRNMRLTVTKLSGT